MSSGGALAGVTRNDQPGAVRLISSTLIRSGRGLVSTRWCRVMPTNGVVVVVVALARTPMTAVNTRHSNTRGMTCRLRSIFLRSSRYDIPDNPLIRQSRFWRRRPGRRFCPTHRRLGDRNAGVVVLRVDRELADDVVGVAVHEHHVAAPRLERHADLVPGDFLPTLVAVGEHVLAVGEPVVRRPAAVVDRFPALVD